MKWKQITSIISILFQPLPGWNTVRSHRQFLRPGLFIYSGGTTYRHWRQPIPEHIRATKARHKPWLEPSMKLRTQIKRILVSLRQLFSRRFFWVKNGSRYQFPIVIAGSNEGECVFLDPNDSKVGRNLSDLISPEQLRLREQWARHVPSPSFSVVDNGAFLMEDYIEGEHLRNLSPVQQTQVYRQIFQYYINITRVGVKYKYRTSIEQALSEDVLVGLDEALRCRLMANNMFSEARNWPLVPTLADSTPGNLIIAEGKKPVFIDSLPIICALFFYTPVFLIGRGRSVPHLRAKFFSGVFDKDLEQIFDSAGVKFFPNRKAREALVTLAFMLRPMQVIVRNEIAFDPSNYARKVNWFFKQSGLSRSDVWT